MECLRTDPSLDTLKKDIAVLSRQLNKKMILIDAYPIRCLYLQNVGVDDYSGGYQIGEYLYSCGYKKALFIAETERDSDYYRWMGFNGNGKEGQENCSYAEVSMEKQEWKARIKEQVKQILKYKPEAVFVGENLFVAYPIVHALRKKHIPVLVLAEKDGQKLIVRIPSGS